MKSSVSAANKADHAKLVEEVAIVCATVAQHQSQQLMHEEKLAAAERSIDERFRQIVEEAKESTHSTTAAFGSDLETFQAELARLKVEMLMLKADSGSGSGSTSAGSGSVHDSPSRRGMSALEQEKAALRASLCCEGGVIPQIDWGSVVVDVTETRQGKLTKLLEFAVDIFIVAPGEHVHVSRAWHQFKDFWDLLRQVGSQITPSPTLPRKEGSDINAIKPKLKACADVILRKCPASHRQPVDRFFALDV